MEVSLSEGQSGSANAGDTIAYTALTGGCLAATACFAEGGGCGVHMVMGKKKGDTDAETQWARFRELLNGKKIAKAFLDGDMIGQAQGWYVKYNDDEKPDTAKPPTSKMELGDEDAQWVYTNDMVVDWFTKLFGNVRPIKTDDKVNVRHLC
jgi:hypothetical protein